MSNAMVKICQFSKLYRLTYEDLLKAQVSQHSGELPLLFKRYYKHQVTALLFSQFLLIFKTDSITCCYFSINKPDAII